jgi:hypothetical protein
MSTISTVTINGIFDPSDPTKLVQIPVTQVEYLTPNVIRDYSAYMASIKQVLDKRTSNPLYQGQPVTDADYAQIIIAINQLTDLAKQGRFEDSTNSIGYINKAMASEIDLLLRSLKSAGISLDSLPTTSLVDAVLLWQSMAGYGITDIVNGTALGPAPTRSLQSMIELEYVKQGNEVIFNALANLEKALTTTQGILDTLQIVQNVANQITVDTVGSFNFPPQRNGDIPFIVASTIANIHPDLRAAYDKDISGANAAVLGHENSTTFAIEFAKRAFFTGFVNFHLNEATVDKATIVLRFEQIYKISASAHFSQIFPRSVATAADASSLILAKNQLLSQLQTLPANALSANLGLFLSKVIKDISSHFLNVSMMSGVRNWVIDSQDKKLGLSGTNTAGNVQDNLTSAIQAAENLNDTQKENVRRYMFLFEEFYKSASAVLQKVSQIVEKLAQGIR